MPKCLKKPQFKMVTNLKKLHNMNPLFIHSFLQRIKKMVGPTIHIFSITAEKYNNHLFFSFVIAVGPHTNTHLNLVSELAK